MLSAYWRARREADQDKRIRRDDLLHELAPIDYDTENGLSVLQSLDDFYLSLHFERIKRATQK